MMSNLATVVRKADEFMFLEGALDIHAIARYPLSELYILEIIPWLSADAPAKRKPKGVSGVKGAPTLLDQFVVSSKGGDKDADEGGDIIMNEDGTMFAAGGSEMEDEFE